MSGEATPVTRSMEATVPYAAAQVARRRAAFPNAWWGVALLVATEATLLLCMVATYFYLQSKSAQWPPPGIEHPKVALPLVLTGVLLLTSVPMALAYASAAAGRLAPARWLILGALVIQGAYLGVQIHELISDIDKVHATSTSYGSIYLTMVASHHAHVAIGMLLSLGILARLMTGLTNYRLAGLRAICLYWYFVNTAAVIVVLTQISPSL